MKQLIIISLIWISAVFFGCESEPMNHATEYGAMAGGLALSTTTAHAHAHGHPHHHGENGCSDKISNKRLLYHEMGHVKWNKLDPYQQQLWTEIWELAIDLGIQPNEPYDDNGECKNYFEFNSCEGFCVAYSMIKTNEAVDPTIKNFFDNL